MRMIHIRNHMTKVNKNISVLCLISCILKLREIKKSTAQTYSNRFKDTKTLANNTLYKTYVSFLTNRKLFTPPHLLSIMRGKCRLFLLYGLYYSIKTFRYHLKTKKIYSQKIIMWLSMLFVNVIYVNI